MGWIDRRYCSSVLRALGIILICYIHSYESKNIFYCFLRLSNTKRPLCTIQVVLFQALAKAQEASALERQLIRLQEQANLGDTHNLDLTFAVGNYAE